MSKDIRYIKQRDKTSCGPIALINILKWIGLPVTYDFIDVARYFCDWIPGFGITQQGMLYGLDQFDIDYMIVYNPSVKQIDDHLDREGIILFDYCFGDIAHYTLCIGHTNYYYNMVNDGKGYTIKKRLKKYMEKIIKNASGTDEECVGIFIFK